MDRNKEKSWSVGNFATMGRLTLRFFGPPEVRRSDGELLPALRTRKGLWLLALLVLRAGKTVERVWLAGQLWPDTPTENGLANLRRTLTDLRRALGQDALQITSPTHTTLLFDPTNIDCDVLTFDGDPVGQLALYKGTLLEGCDEEWVFAERRQREERYIEARLALARSAPRDEAYEHLKALLDTDPFHEEALRRLMELGMQLGRQSEALGVFRGFRERLSAQRLVPDPQTQALYADLQAKLRQPAPPPIRHKWTESAPLRLPQPPTVFVGRREEQTELVSLLLYEPLVTILGMGGLGKTRLALRIAEELSGEFPDGVAFVELAPLPTSDTLITTVALSLGRRCESLEELVAALASQRLLLVLDNAEHLLPTCRTLIQTLRQGCPQLAFLITSREPLELPGEVHWRLGPLRQSDSQQLFVQCAGRARPGLALETETLTSLCQQLEGIPLALELAAGRLGVLTPGQLAERLMERFRLLSGGAAHPERHRTLRTVLESSWEQLSTQQQRTLAQLSVFRGGCSLEGAAFVVFPDEDELAALDQLTALVNHSLVFAENGRFRLLETVRLFAQARLTQSESEAAHTRLLQWLNTLASRNTEDSQGHLWLSQMEAERANLRVAVDFVREHPEHRELFFSGLDLVMATDPLYRLHGGIAESQRELLYFLEHLPNTHSEFGRAHWVAGRLAFLQADFVASRAHYDQAEKHSSEWGRIHVLISRGILRREQGELAQAKADFMESKQICQARGGDPAWANDGLASVAWLMGEYEEARQLMGGVIAQNRQENSHIALASNLLWWAKIVRDQGHFEEETAALYEALSLSQELGYTQSAAGALCGQAECYLRVGDTSVALGLLTEAHELLKKAPHVVQNARLQLVQVMALRQSGQLTEAEKNLREVLSCFLKAGIPDGLILGLIEAGSLRQAQGEEEQAAHFFGAADTLRLRYGFVLPPSRQTQFVTSSHSLTHQEALARIALL